MRISDMRIGVRLGIGFGIILLLMIINNIISISGLKTTSGATEKLYRHPFTVSTAALRIDADIIRIHRDMRNIALARTPAEIRAAREEIERYEKRISDDFDVLEERFLGDKSQVEAVKRLFAEWKPIRDEVIETMTLVGRDGFGTVEATRSEAQVKQLTDDMDHFIEFAAGKAQEFLENSQTYGRRAVLINYGVSAFVLIVSLFLAIFITRGITVPISRVGDAARTMASGDMTRQLGLGRKDECGQLADSLDIMSESLREDLAEISAVADRIDNAASQLAEASESLSEGAAEQASSLEELASTMVEIDSQVKNNADYAERTSQSVKGLKETADAGLQEMKKMTQAMGEIDEAGKSIAKIIKVIDAIASQTNLLALNATIEAASAGDAGRGFAVVANEIKELANQSAKAAGETAELIESTIRKVEKGGEIANGTADALLRISEASVESARMTAEIAASTQEQAESIVQVTQGLEQVDQVTQMNTASAEETASSAQELATQSSGLRQILSKFKLSEGEISTLNLQEKKRQSAAPAKMGEGKGAAFGKREIGKDGRTPKKRVEKEDMEYRSKGTDSDEDFERY